MTQSDRSRDTRKICQIAPVIPVLVIDDLSVAKPLARALIAGGLPVLEITLRTPVALQAICEMAEIPGGTVGVGTLLTPKDAEAAKQAGAKFCVSPGATDRLLSACEETELPLLPGAATASEAMRLLERGYTVQKFFPAEASGGAATLKAIGAPIPQVSFCPTGGVTPQNVADYLALSNTLCVGGSWVAPRALIDNQDWPGIEALARTAAQM